MSRKSVGNGAWPCLWCEPIRLFTTRRGLGAHQGSAHFLVDWSVRYNYRCAWAKVFPAVLAAMKNFSAVLE